MHPCQTIPSILLSTLILAVLWYAWDAGQAGCVSQGFMLSVSKELLVFSPDYVHQKSLYTCSLQTKLPRGVKSGARVNPCTDLRASHVRVGVPRHGKQHGKVKVGTPET